MTTKLPILYKYSSKGKLQQWQIIADGDSFFTEAGQVDGKITTAKPTKCKPKNSGRANATTAEEQAIAEAEAKWKKKKKSGYAESIEALEELDMFYEPMLAHEYKKRYDTGNVKFPVIVQRKLDGIRCVAQAKGAFTRNGEEHLTIPHIKTSLKSFFAEWEDNILDGELYNHELKDDFNKIASLVKKKKPTIEDLFESEDMVRLYVYDAPIIGALSERHSFEMRYKKLRELVDSKFIVFVENHIAHSHEEVVALHDQFVDEGYEGAIIRIPGSTYKNGRSNDLLKFKSFNDEEFIIQSIRPGKGNKAKMAAHADFFTHEGKPFTANIKGPHTYLKQLLKDRADVVGKPATVQFFRYTPDGIPRFPYMISVRDYE